MESGVIGGVQCLRSRRARARNEDLILSAKSKTVKQNTYLCPGNLASSTLLENTPLLHFFNNFIFVYLTLIDFLYLSFSDRLRTFVPFE